MAAIDYSAKIDGVLARKLPGPPANGFREYFLGVIERFSTVKTLINPEELTKVSDIYVTQEFNFNHRPDSFNENEILVSFRNHKRVAIIGTAGGGKSMFVRNLIVNFVVGADEADPLPIPFELRTLNDLAEISLLEAIHGEISQHAPDLSEPAFHKLLRDGRFCLVLDGIDEIDYFSRKSRLTEINNIVAKFPNLAILVTSRPEEGYTGLTRFREYRVKPLSLEQAHSLISKINYNSEKQAAFIERLLSGLYRSHSSFASNPLLLTMMLLVFSQVGEIPDNIIEFYRQSFEVLFSKHDRSKGIYERKLRSNLAITAFERIISFFAFSTYSLGVVEFFESEVEEMLSDALKYDNFTGSASDVLYDLLESICILKRDGLKLTFVHRSFQEYFAAIFISRLNLGDLNMAVEDIIKRSSFDNVISMLYKITPSRFEEEWALPACSAALRKINRVNIECDPKRALLLLYRYFAFTGEVGVIFPGDSQASVGLLITVMKRIYPEIDRVVSDIDEYKYDDEDDSFVELVKSDRILRRELSSLLGEEEFDGLPEGATTSDFEIELASDLLIQKLDFQRFIYREREILRRCISDMKARKSGRSKSVKKILMRVR